MDSEGESEDGRQVALEARLAFPSPGVCDFDAASGPSIRQRKAKRKVKPGSFETLGLGPDVLRGIKRKGYQVPTPIQRKALPLVLGGHDVVAMARTGSGKTAAFLIPMLEKLKTHSPMAGARAVILSPTRELALQTFKFTKELGRYMDLRAAVLVGGDSMESQFEDLAMNPDILVATPGRLMHHLSEVEGMSLRSVEYVVFDEADRLFEMGFAEQLRQILHHMSSSRQTLLFSATLPKLLAEFARAGLKDPELIRLDVDSKISSDLKLRFFVLRQEEKPAALLHLLREVVLPEEQTIIFVATKHHVEYLHELLQTEGFSPSVVYGAMDQAARKIHVAKFRARKSMLLVVTDVAARGIDIPLLDNVINYDFPAKPKLFVHRVGRAARAGRKGTAFSFFTQDELPFVLDLHLFLSRPLVPAPPEDEVEASNGALVAATEAALQKGDTVYGRFPQPLLDLGMEKIRELNDRSGPLETLYAICTKAFRLYAKTRPAASSQSVLRSKGLKGAGVHPLLRRVVNAAEAAAAAFAEHLKNFRPHQTVLEAEAQAAKAKRRVIVKSAVDVMREKRAAHNHAIAAAKRSEAEAVALSSALKREALGGGHRDPDSGSGGTPSTKKGKKRPREADGASEPPANAQKRGFRDEEFYISGIQQNRFAEKNYSVAGGRGGGDAAETYASRMDAEVLDLVPDDSEGAQKRRATYQWDRKSKKYVKLNAGEKFTASGKIKTESGARVNAGNRGIYKKWQERSHMRVATAGEEGGDHVGAAGVHGRGQGSGGRGRGRGRGRGGAAKSGPRPNAHVRDELKGVEEVRKSRQKKVALRGGRGGSGRGGGGGGRGTPGGSRRGGKGGAGGQRGKKGGRGRGAGKGKR